jgi:hypothetical protein
MPKRICRDFGGKTPGQPRDIPRAQNQDWHALTGLAAVFMSLPGAYAPGCDELGRWPTDDLPWLPSKRGTSRWRSVKSDPR